MVHAVSGGLHFHKQLINTLFIVFDANGTFDMASNAGTRPDWPVFRSS